MRISDWSSDVCSSDLGDAAGILAAFARAFLLGLVGEAVGIDHGHAMLALPDAAPGIAGLFEGKPALRGKAMLEQCAPQHQHIHPGLISPGHLVAPPSWGCTPPPAPPPSPTDSPPFHPR